MGEGGYHKLIGKVNLKPEKGHGLCKYLFDDYKVGVNDFANSTTIVMLLQDIIVKSSRVNFLHTINSTIGGRSWSI